MTALKELMDAWERIEAQAKKEMPNATAEQIYSIVSSAMNFALRNVFEKKGESL